MEMEHYRNGTITAGLTTGVIGTALGVLNGAGGLLGRSGWGEGYDGRNVGWHDLGLVRELMATEQRLAIAEADKYTDQKLVEVYTALNRQDKEINAKIDMIRAGQEEVNKEQAVYNAVNGSAVKCIREDVNRLMSLTKWGIPNENILPGWGPITEPAPAPATPTAGA